MTRTFFLLAKSHRQAEQIVEQFRTAGFSPNEISIAYNEALQHEPPHAETAQRPQSKSGQQQQRSGQSQQQTHHRNLSELNNPGTVKAGELNWHVAGPFANNIRQEAKSGNDSISNALTKAGVPDREAKRIAERLKDTQQILIAVNTDASKLETARGIAEKNGATETYATHELAGTTTERKQW